ncbi:MAG: flagellar biosynthesis anti-sigma factor FlgM [Nitrospinota bacterium]|nr:flagellar biosynthesis anti-sigma factor FlgM [Nitrospinota bacterium]
MEIPGNDIRIKNKTIQDRMDVAGKKSASQKPDAASTGQVAGGEQIALSAKAKGIQKALETVQTSPDIRSEKVAEIKNQIASNTYRVDSEALAEKILREIITESQFIE